MEQKQSILSAGAAMVGRNKRYVIWFWLLNLALGWMGGTAFNLRAHALLDHSLYAGGLVHGFDLGVLTEMLVRPEFGPMQASTAPAMWLAVLFFLLTMAFLPGVLQGYASDHRTSRGEFFRACGMNLWRFVRLTILFAIVGGIVGGILFGIQNAVMKAADASTHELLPFYLLMTSLTIIFLIMTSIRMWFDLAEADIVLSDERAVRKSLGRAFRQMRGHCAGLLGSYVAIAIVGVIVFVVGIWLWNAIVPPASVIGAFLVSQAILVTLLAVRFWQRAAAVAFYGRSAVAPVLETSPVLPFLTPDPVFSPPEPSAPAQA